MDEQARSNSIDKVLGVLSALQDAGEPQRLVDLCHRTGLAKSTTHRMLAALTAAGMVAREGSHYRPTRQPMADPRRDLLRRLAPFVGDLLVRTGLSASLAVLAGTEVRFAHRVYSHRDVAGPDDSDRATAWETASGRVLLAYDHQATEASSELARIRKHGFAELHGRHGTTCVAVPLRFPGIALAVRGASDLVDQERALHWLRLVSDAATREVRRAA